LAPVEGEPTAATLVESSRHAASVLRNKSTQGAWREAASVKPSPGRLPSGGYLQPTDGQTRSPGTRPGRPRRGSESSRLFGASVAVARGAGGVAISHRIPSWACFCKIADDEYRIDG
jgi:hypothetical protein